LPVPTNPRIRYTKLFNNIVHRRLRTKVNKICYTYKAPEGLFTVTIWHRSCSRKIFGESQKFTNFITERI